MENLHFFFQLSNGHVWPHCQGVHIATEEFHIDISCHRNTQIFQAISGLEPLRCHQAIRYPLAIEHGYRKLPDLVR
jgi:hypothetical protein